MSIVRITRDLSINKNEIASIEWDRRDYVNGPGSTYLIITMNHGGKHRIEHAPWVLDPVDCYKIEEKLRDA